MTTTVPMPPRTSRGYGSLHPRGPLSWLLTTDHKRVAVLFFAVNALTLALGGALGLLLRLELLTPAKALVDEHGYDRIFTAHGLILVALFLVPAVPTTFGNYLLPLMVGARGLAMPRLALATLYVHLAGAGAVLFGLVRGGVDSGWTIYPASGESSPESIAIVLGGLAVVALAWTLTAANFVATVHGRRGVGFAELPIFASSLYVWSLATIAAAIALALGIAVAAARPGPADPALLRHLRWFAAHGAAYPAILPLLGAGTEVVVIFARKAPLSRRALLAAFAGIAATGLVTSGHHVFAAGSLRSAALFGLPSLLLAALLASAILGWLGALHRGSVAPRAPLLYALAFAFFLTFGIASGLGLAASALGAQWHGTWFVVAHLHFMLAGCGLSALLAALHCWYPKVTGRLYSERFALLAAAPVFVGLVLAFFPEFLFGNAGMPRRSPTYPDALEPLHVIAAAGSWVLAAGLAGAAGVLLAGLRWGEPAGPNPWGAPGLEWTTASPPPPANFDADPRGSSAGP